MYDLNKRAYISTLGELRSLFAALPDDTEIYGAGDYGAWLHFDNEKNFVCIDPESLYSDYSEEYGDEEETAEIEQMKAHESRMVQPYGYDDGWQAFFVGDKLMRTYLVIDDSIDEVEEGGDGECFGACWDFELYNIKLTPIESGQLGKQGNMTREEVTREVLSWRNLENKERTYFAPTEDFVELCETWNSHEE